jgi:hypothetical protein
MSQTYGRWKLSREDIQADIQILEEEISRAGGRSSVQVPTSPEASAVIGREWEFQHEKVLALKAEVRELRELLMRGDC